MTFAHQPSNPRGLAALRRFSAAQPAAPVERCELCAASVPGDHQHLVDPRARHILCVCNACAVLFDRTGATQFRRVPRQPLKLSSLDLSEDLWARLGIPIGLVFFFRSSVSKTVLGVYPSPGGPTETAIDQELWSEVEALDGLIAALTEDVEALLVNRVRGAREYFILPIDECYKLAGVIRRHWRGFSGGDELWERLDGFFDELRKRDA